MIDDTFRFWYCFYFVLLFFMRSDLFLLRPCQLPIHLWCFTIMAVSTGKMRKVLWSLVVEGIVFHSELILMRDQSWSNFCRTELFLFVRQCNQPFVMLAVVKEILVNKRFYIIVNKQRRDLWTTFMCISRDRLRTMFCAWAIWKEQGSRIWVDLTSNFVKWIKTIMEQGLYFPYVSFGLTGPLHGVKLVAVTLF